MTTKEKKEESTYIKLVSAIFDTLTVLSEDLEKATFKAHDAGYVHKALCSLRDARIQMKMLRNRLRGM